MRAPASGTSSRQHEHNPASKASHQCGSALPKIVSLFSGAGGLDLGFKLAGFEIAFAADNMQAAIDTHKHNFPNCISELTDLASTDTDVFLRRVAETVKADERIAVIGGPPCQGFSRSNSSSAASDPRNQLIAHYCEIVKKLQSVYTVDFVLFENVLGIKDKKHEETYKSFLDALASAGLPTYERVLLATDFRVPQTRKRVIVLGSSTGDLLTHLKAIETPKSELTVRHAFRGIGAPIFFRHGLKPAEIEPHVNHWTMQPRSPRFKEAAFKGAGRSFRQLKWDAESPTIAMGHREIPVHPAGKRRISIWEAMRLQGFPDYFEIKGNLSEQVTLVSNAVPPPLAEALAVAIKGKLLAGEEGERIAS